jgi:hypothetical protein
LAGIKGFKDNFFFFCQNALLGSTLWLFAHSVMYVHVLSRCRIDRQNTLFFQKLCTRNTRSGAVADVDLTGTAPKEALVCSANLINQL